MLVVQAGEGPVSLAIHKGQRLYGNHCCNKYLETNPHFNAQNIARHVRLEIIAVIGATGSQGGGLARAILDDPGSDFRVRAITRNPDSDAARALADRGAEVVQADLDDVESLKRAFDGAYGAFCVTNFWEHFSPQREQAQVANLAEAAKAAGAIPTCAFRP